MATEKETIDGCEKKEEDANLIEVEEKGVKEDPEEVGEKAEGPGNEEAEEKEVEDEELKEDREDEEVREEHEEEEAEVEGKGEDVDEDDDGKKIDGEESEKKSEISKKRTRKQRKGELESPRRPGSERPTRERKMVERFMVGETPKASASKALSIEKEPLKMETRGLSCWTYDEKKLFNELMRDFRNGALDSVLSNNAFADGVDYWDEALWVNFARVYNLRADALTLPKREPYELILRGEKVRGEFSFERSNKCISPILDQIFLPSRDCNGNWIPIFPVSTPISGDRAASAGSVGHPEIDVSGATRSVGHVESRKKMIDIICDLEEKGLLSSDEAATVFNLTDTWIKGPSTWVKFVLDTKHSDQQKARLLKSCVHL